MSKNSSGGSGDKTKNEAAVRAAATAAARGVPLGEAVLSNIVARTSDAGLSDTERTSRAASLAEQHVASDRPLNLLSASPNELAAQQQAAMQFSAQRGGAWPLMHGRDGGRSSDRATSADYSKIGTGAVSDAVYKALESDGLTRRQIDGAAMSARTMGWNDRDSIKHLAHAGKEFGSLAERYHQAQKDGDTARATAIMRQMQEQRDAATGKKKEGMSAIIGKFEKLNASSSRSESTLTAQDQAKRAEAAPQDAAAAKAIFDKLKAQRSAPST